MGLNEKLKAAMNQRDATRNRSKSQQAMGNSGQGSVENENDLMYQSSSDDDNNKEFAIDFDQIQAEVDAEMAELQVASR